MADSLYIANLEKTAASCSSASACWNCSAGGSTGWASSGRSPPATTGRGSQTDPLRYAIPLDDEEMTGVSHDQAGRSSPPARLRLFREIVRKYNGVRGKCDFLLCEGPTIFQPLRGL